MPNPGNTRAGGLNCPPACYDAKAANGSAEEAALVAGFAPQADRPVGAGAAAALGGGCRAAGVARCAVLGPGAAPADAAALAGLEPPAAVPAADALIEAHLATAGDGTELVAPLIQAAVYEGLGLARGLRPTRARPA